MVDPGVKLKPSWRETSPATYRFSCSKHTWLKSTKMISNESQKTTINFARVNRKADCCWINNAAATDGNWRLLTSIDLGVRSDTSQPNRSPVATTIPIIRWMHMNHIWNIVFSFAVCQTTVFGLLHRVPQNCPRNYSLLSCDPDKDQVRCRYGILIANECGMCNVHAGFTLDQVRNIVSNLWSQHSKNTKLTIHFCVS